MGIGHKKKSQVSELDKYLLKDQIEPKCSKFLNFNLMYHGQSDAFPPLLKFLALREENNV